ncbi:MAG: CTP synthase [Firmicutes bacterium]|nr:CTP synthase [Bacillota bacterium]
MNKQGTKYIFVTGGVCSGLGKGITVASLGRLLKARGYKVTIQKFDPYINMQPGLLSPYQHGEVYVTEDGAEVDLDLGHYERFIDENLGVNNSVSAGKIYWEVLNKERKGAYKGATVQIIPHITDAIKERICLASKDAQSDIIISEIGGTVGDIESLPFIEAIRQISQDKGTENVMYIHLVLVPYLSFADEMKTKPAQNAVKDLMSLGIKPDAIVCRTDHPMPDDMRTKLAMFCNVDQSCIIENRDVNSLYEIPLLLEDENFADIVCKQLSLDNPAPDLIEWRNLVNHEKQISKDISICLVGKYTELRDAYLSVVEAIKHAGIGLNVNVNIKWINSRELDYSNAATLLSGVSGILMPDGYGQNGVDGLISAARYAREQKIPFLGIGLGMQCAMIEYARDVMGLADAASAEENPDVVMPIFEYIDRQEGNVTGEKPKMRLGAQHCKLAENSLLEAAYGENQVYERFRHLCKLNNMYRNDFIKHGMIEAAISHDEKHVEGIELPTDVHPWFVGVQFRPEFKSRITKPSPLIKAFLNACLTAANV